MHSFNQLAIPEKSVGIHWFGQSSFGIKHPTGTIVLVDPYFPHERPAEKYIRPEPPLKEAELRTDFILLTHDHSDHTCMESIERIHAAHRQVRFIGPHESAGRLTAGGIPNEKITVVTAGETTTAGPMNIHTVWAKPPEGISEDNIAEPDVQHIGFVVEVGDVRVYISGDPVNTFANHEDLLQPIRDLKPDIGLLTNHPTEGEFPFFEGSAKTAVELGLKTAVPAHYDCFVKRTYDPKDWASHLPPNGPTPLIIPYNQAVVYP